MIRSSVFFFFVLLFMASCKPVIQTSRSGSVDFKTDSVLSEGGITHRYLYDVLKQYPQYFASVLSNPEHKIQIIYTRIDRRSNGLPRFTDFYFNVNDAAYFYPASTVKLPVAALALQKLNELNIPGLDKNAMMITEAEYSGQTEVFNDPTTPDGRPTIAHYIKKILLVSDNDAFNRLYEFLGQEYINSTLHNMGYKEAQVIHRLDISLTEDENRHSNPVRFFDSSGKVIFEKPLEKSGLAYANRNTKMGKGYYRGGVLVNEPFDFSKKNRLSLRSLHSIVRSILFPESVPVKQKFNLSKDDYDFLRRYMSMMPQESDYPYYDRENYWDTYVKFLFYGSEKNMAKDGIRVFNKVGDAYGFLIDAAYINDFKNGVEFMLSAVIHCNSDGIFNDDKYDYDEVGFPFLKNLGQAIYQHEINRVRKHKPDLSQFRFDY